jgi:hypothetical protein
MLGRQVLVFENLNMKAIDILIDVPCFKCLFAEPIMESHLHCNPNECTKLTEWLLVQVEQDDKTKETVSMAVVRAQTQRGT